MRAKEEQLCWNCKRATGGCSWSASGEPVENWIAEPTVVMDVEGEIASYKIMGCPLFESDERCRFRELRRVSFRELAEIIKVNYRHLREISTDEIRRRCKREGFDIKIKDKRGRRCVYLKKAGESDDDLL